MRIAFGLLVVVGLVACGARSGPRRLFSGDGVRFALDAPEARSVAVCGSFNGWSPTSHLLERREGRGAWTLVVPLPPGDHAFMYLVDGERWVTPPEADDEVPDGFGGKNGVVHVR